MDGDGMLSQDEINALLNGMDLSDDGGNSGNAPADSGSNAAGNPGCLIQGDNS